MSDFTFVKDTSNMESRCKRAIQSLHLALLKLDFQKLDQKNDSCLSLHCYNLCTDSLWFPHILLKMKNIIKIFNKVLTMLTCQEKVRKNHGQEKAIGQNFFQFLSKFGKKVWKFHNVCSWFEQLHNHSHILFIML